MNIFESSEERCFAADVGSSFANSPEAPEVADDYMYNTIYQQHCELTVKQKQRLQVILVGVLQHYDLLQITLQLLNRPENCSCRRVERHQ